MKKEIATIIKEGQERARRSIAKAIGMVFVVPIILTGLAWFNNIMVARQWNPQDGHGATYHGPLPWFDRFAVDFSTVSTLIPFFGSLLIAVGFARISKTEKNSNPSEYFPFSKSYTQITVALGLIGTVWGLIMIGYYPPKTVQMEQLILCLRTALYSTLVALIWVFLFVFPIRYIMQGMCRYVSGYKNPKATENILSLLDQLGSVASGATEGLSKTSSEFMALNQQISETRTKLGEVEGTLTEVKGKTEEVFNETKKVMGQVHSESLAWQKAAEEQQKAAKEERKTAEAQQKVVRKLGEELDKERRQKEETGKRAAKAERERDEAKSKLRRLADYVRKTLEIKS